ncbi:Gti1/Pac2 family-domain-containing protein [Xylaria arbuscula]|nr:Gti1/Pac2 family-domain-containing protein [Xylaria arbuscula]
MSNRPSANGPLSPTMQGYVASTMDALIIFEACLSGVLAHVPRRPHDRERPDLIKSGNIFVYEEHSSGVKRWTDGIAWSPSRILSNFLLYRELDRPFQPGEKKRAMKRTKFEAGVSNQMTTLGHCRPSSVSPRLTMSGAENMDGNADRQYVGSLVDSYSFKEGGLIKKTISITHQGIQHHLVSYYCLDDIKTGRLKSVALADILTNVVPRDSLLQTGSFRAPIDDSDLRLMDTARVYPAGYPGGALDYTRSISIPPSISLAHPQGWANAQQYPQSAAYHLPQGMQQPPASGYGQQQVVPFAYEGAVYRPSGYGSIEQNRRHSMVHSTNSTATLGYSSTMMNHHGMPYSGYFDSSAANAAAENASTSATGVYDPTGTIGQSNGAHSMEDSIPHSTDGFDGQIVNGYDSSINRLAINDFGGPLQDSAGSMFGAASTSATPNDLPMCLEHPEISPADHEWNRTDHGIHKNEATWP